MIIGSTGSGKSTLTNALVGNSLIVITNPNDEDKVAIELAEGIKGAEIGHSPAISQTSVPECMVDENNNVYIDCPGFGDTKSAEQDIVNAIYIKQIFENLKEIKIVVVAQEAEFASAGRGALIINLID